MIHFEEGKYIINKDDFHRILEEAAIKAIEVYEDRKRNTRKSYKLEGCMSRPDLMRRIGQYKVDKFVKTGFITPIKSGPKNSKVFFSTQELESQGII